MAEEQATTTDATAAAATTTATTTDKGIAAATTTAAAGADKATTATDKAAAATTTAEPAKGVWPEDWVSRMSKGDEKVANQFKRYASPEALAEAHISLRRRMDAGEFRSVLPKDPKPEELAAWRKENGIPEKHDGYSLEGMTIPEQDKAAIDGFLKAAHARNFSPEQVRESLSFYYADHERVVNERLAKDDEQRQSGLDALNQEWGGQFRRNVNLVEAALAKFPESVRNGMRQARLPDGTLLFNHPDAVRGMLAIALESNPAGIVVPAAGGDLGKTALEEYRGIKKEMRENRAAYNKDEAKQSRMRELIEYLSANEIIDANGNEIAARRKAA